MRSGIGRLLVAEARIVAREFGARELTVVAALEAEGFYRRCGFAVTGQVPTRFGPAIAMRVTLASFSS